MALLRFGGEFRLDLGKYRPVLLKIRTLNQLIQFHHPPQLRDCPCQPPLLPVHHRNVEQRNSFARLVPHLFLDRQRLLVVLQRLLPLPQAVVDAADVVERNGEPVAFTYFLGNRSNRLVPPASRSRTLRQPASFSNCPAITSFWISLVPS